MDAASSRNSDATSGFGAEDWLRFDLQPECELRVEVSEDAKSPAQLRLTRGTVEVLGRELALDQAYELRPGTRLGFFTWHGCRLEVRGLFQVPPYIADETSHPLIINLHSVLQRQREEGQRPQRGRHASPTPRVVVVGPRDSGKVTVAATLAAYALRHLGARLVWLDLDPSAGLGPCSRLVAVPGSLTMVSLHRPLLALEDTSAFERPLSWYFGHLQPSDNRKAYLTLVEAMRQQVHAWTTQLEAKAASTLEGNPDPNVPKLYNAGYIAVLPSWTDTMESFGLLEETLIKLAPTCVVVMESERLQVLLRRTIDTHADFGTARHPELIRIPKSGGVVPRDISARRRERSKRFRAYFYGHGGELHPHPLWVSNTDVVLYRVGGQALAPQTALPLGETLDDQDTAEIEILAEPKEEMLHAVCAVSQASDSKVRKSLQPELSTLPGTSTADQLVEGNGMIVAQRSTRLEDPTVVASLQSAPVFGFVQITAVDRYRNRLRLLSPSPGKLPSDLIHVSSDLRWTE
jgi:polyribonucleotide 5'-hydroxyl-kinase